MIEKNDYALNITENIYDKCKIVILQHPYMVNLIKDLDGKTVIYESLNCEYNLKKEILAQHPMATFLIEKTKEVEQRALYKSDLVISVSEEEVEALKSLSPKSNNRIEVIRNGVSVVLPKFNYKQLKEFLDDRTMITFIGSGHSPNVDACNYIINELAPQTPDYLYCIIGSVCDGFESRILPDNILLFGKIDAEYKDFLLFSTDIALNPMVQGAGSNLKLAEYFAFKIPTITTNCGARGYDVENGIQAIICERSKFKENIEMIIRNVDLANTLREEAYQYVIRNLEWSTLGEKYNKILDELPKKKMLVLTYRFNDAPKGGAEVYLTNVLEAIARSNNYFIDIATTDIGEINDKFRFSHEYTKDNNIDISEVYGIKAIKHNVDVINEAYAWKLAKDIYFTFMSESRTLSEKFINLYREPILLGGWHFPEKSDTGYKVWSSEKSSIFVQGVFKIKIRGFSNKRKMLKIALDGEVIEEKVCEHDFILELDGFNGSVLDLLCDSFVVNNMDPRSLGVLITDVAYKLTGNDCEYKVDFTKNFRDVARIDNLEAYISEMILATENRADDIDQSFIKIRGPLSSSLETWLDRNIKRYDVILGHSTPFNTLVTACRYGNKHNVPTALLPHFHMEEDYYHWKSYYEAFKNANVTIVAPEICDKLFFKKLGANSVCIPGGGIFKEEYELEVKPGKFMELYNDKTPFVLTLGRKSGAKNYRYAIESVEKLNNMGINVKLVMIGKDEDKQTINSPYVKYLGMQPRDVVLSAIKESIALINMSESESFGIVILEAWMLKKAVIVNERCAAFAELVDHEENGLLTAPENLHQNIIKLLENPLIAKKMGENGYIKTSNKYTWENIACEIENILDLIQVK